MLARDDSLDPADPVISPLPAATAFEQLLAHAHPFELLTGPERRRRMLQRLLELCRSVEAYELRFAPSLRHLPVLAVRLAEHSSS
jgi:hypothetical protein